MFYYLNGVVAHMAPFLAVIDCGGVGYAAPPTTPCPICKRGSRPSSIPT